MERFEVSSEEKLQRLIIGQLKLIRSTPAIPAILFSRELHVENDRLRHLFFRLMQRFHGLAARFLDEGQRTGASGRGPRSGRRRLPGHRDGPGLVLRWSLSKRGFDLLAEGERLLGVLLRGFRAPEGRSGPGRPGDGTSHRASPHNPTPARGRE